MELEPPDNLPESLLKEVKKHSESFVIIHFNKDGLPILNVHTPTLKDFLALERLVMEYGSVGLPLPPEMNEGDVEDEDGDDDGGESWKK